SKAIKVSFAVAPETLLEEVMPILIQPGHRFADFLKTVLGDALGRLVLPTIEREVRRRLTRQAEEHAIEVFAANLESLLMTPPLANTRVLVIQPGFRSGCKVAVLDVDGTLLAETILYPHEPKKQWLEGKTALLAAIHSHNVQAIAIGNGTGCRATEEFVSEVIEENHLDLQYTIVNEAGAGAYADSPLAKEEFPNLEASLRATISIGRRLQNPLAELVKIDPRAVGVGLYQHDVNQEHLKAVLEETVTSCVAAVGADANTASPALLRYVPGLGPQAVEALAARRRAGPIASREELRALSGWDDPGASAERDLASGGPGFLQAAGFLGVTGPNPLDATRIHPESYAAAERLLARVGHTAQDLTSADSAKALEKDLTGISLEPLADDVGVPMLELVDLVGALQHPHFDPRSKHAPSIFRKKVRHIEDLQPGMWVKGTVRNVVDFGAFVDVGLAEDGLVHISQFSPRYIRNPMKFLHAGDVVEVRVVSIDADRNRIALTLIPDRRPAKPKPAPRRPAKKPAAASAGAASAEAPAAPAKAAPARGARPRGGRTPSAKTVPAERRASSGERRPSRRPPQGPREGAPGKPGGARSARTERTGPPGRSRKDRPSPRSGEPRIHVFRDEPAESPDETDDEGRPKIRWAHYESDLREAETPGEIETFEETEAVEETPAVEETESPGSAKETHDAV
ncbi:MAG: S1 RNA-binding domain-containing protein, partial [Planctomycetota bacterium]|nr:S1 RNA-binding domain-containing protein [Planctomycetota bacterium]